MAVAFEIVTPTRVAWKGEADQVRAPGVLGEFGVLPSHAALLSATRAGVLTIHQGSESTRLVVGPGFAEVGAGEMTLLVDFCEDAASVDKGQAATDLAAAEGVLGSVSPDTKEFVAAQRKAALAAARLDA